MHERGQLHSKASTLRCGVPPGEVRDTARDRASSPPTRKKRAWSAETRVERGAENRGGHAARPRNARACVVHTIVGNNREDWLGMGSREPADRVPLLRPWGSRRREAAARAPQEP